MKIKVDIAGESGLYTTVWLTVESDLPDGRQQMSEKLFCAKTYTVMSPILMEKNKAIASRECEIIEVTIRRLKEIQKDILYWAEHNAKT